LIHSQSDDLITFTKSIYRKNSETIPKDLLKNSQKYITREFKHQPRQISGENSLKPTTRSDNGQSNIHLFNQKLFNTI
jgi:hypothetical protein